MTDQPATADHQGPHTGNVLRIRAFRRLWIGLGLSSLGDWIGLLALVSFANGLAGDSYQHQSYAVGSVLLLRVLPAIIIGPLAGYVADRLDRRWTLIVGDVLRGVVFATIPIVGTLWWVMVATVIIEAISLVWLPAKDATVPNLVPPSRLEQANQISIATTYGSAVPAAGLFVLLTLSNKGLTATTGWLDNPVLLALWFNALTFVVSGLVIAVIHEIPKGAAIEADEGGVWGVIREGWSFVARTPLIRGLVVGITGAFAAGGVVVGLARIYVTDLEGGDAGFGVLFAAVFTGLGVGMGFGTKALDGFTRRRLFGFALTMTGVMLLLIAAIPNLVVVCLLAVALGFFAGAGWISGYTLLGLEVSDELRGRTFAFVQTLIRLSLSLVLGLGPLLAALIGQHTFHVSGAVLHYNGAAFTILGAAVLMMIVGATAYRQMNDRPGVSVVTDLRSSLVGDRGRYAPHGVFVALEGGEGAGKSTQATLLRDWLEAEGYTVLLTHEPGDSVIGRQVRSILLDPATGTMADRAEALLYAADKAEHVDRVVEPALAAGQVVVTDRYVDSTLAYQGAGRTLERDEVAHVARWATGDLRPHLTVLLDVDPEVGLSRFDSPDRLEAEPVAFHRRVRQGFRELADADPDHYLVVDASDDRAQIAAAIRHRLGPLLAQAERHESHATQEAT